MPIEITSLVKYLRLLYFISESERSSILDTLPEGKQVYSGSQSTYRRVYPDWKPSATIDKTDVMSAMEAVEGKNLISLFIYKMVGMRSSFLYKIHFSH